MRVLLTVASFDLSYGGPALSVSRLGKELARKGAEVALWAPDGSAGRSSVISDEARLKCLAGPLLNALDSFAPRIIHDNGIWLPYNRAVASAAAKRGIPRVVSPRGMLEPWAFDHKAWKKRLAFTLYQRSDLARAAAIHTTSDEEARNFSRFGLSVPVHIVPNGVDLPDLSDRVSQPRSSQCTLLFLSRVHPKKGPLILVDAFAAVGPNGWRVLVAGPDELNHTEEVKRRTRDLAVDSAFTFLGPQYGTDKDRLFAEADLFILPTHSENFGMAIAEALAHAVPVITTTGTPWAALPETGCGWWVAPTAEAIAGALREAVSLSPGMLREMGRRGRCLVAERYAWDNVGLRLAAIYDGLL